MGERTSSIAEEICRSHAAEYGAIDASATTARRRDDVVVYSHNIYEM